MKELLQNNYIRYSAIVILLLLLVGIRFFEKDLFYDPFLSFFKSVDYQNKPLPQINTVKLLGGVSLRYFLNALLSVGIIYLLFRESSLLKFSAGLFLVLFVILIGLFYILISQEENDYLVLFYVRRFLIQPLFLILFIPAFYYQNKLTTK